MVTFENILQEKTEIQTILHLLLLNFYCIIGKFSKSSAHGIYNNGKTILCDCDENDFWHNACYSLYRISFGMKPNSGIYQIRMKIDEINNVNRWSAVGITIESIDDEKLDKDYYSRNYWGYSNNYIGWSSYHVIRYAKIISCSNMKNGLLIGASNSGQNVQDNIFIKSKFLYKSNNQYYENGLPNINNGDTIIIKYDSNNSILSFYKTNDAKLNAQISKLPKNKTFYWFAGRYSRQFSVAIV